MLVCVCHGVKDQDIERAIQNGVNSMTQLSDKLNLGTSCGCCMDYAEEYLKDRQLVRPCKRWLDGFQSRDREGSGADQVTGGGDAPG